MRLLFNYQLSTINYLALKFKDFNLSPQINQSIDAMGFEDATPIQELAIPNIIENKDIIACAQTGTGKTAAYLLPVLHKLSLDNNNSINTLIIVPTRELALQIDQQLQGFSYFVDISSVAIYGGGDADNWTTQKQAIVRGANIIIATPGRLLSHLSFGYGDFSRLKHFILDEADRMLDMGFYDDIMKINSFTPKDKQTLMFSATMPDKIRLLADKMLNNPIEINLSISKPAENILQIAYLVYDENKISLIQQLVKGKELNSILIFSATKKNVKEIRKSLQNIGFLAGAIHSDLDQSDREQVLLDFSNRKKQVLVATDIVSRGIDITDIDLVINFDVPNDAEDYVHRVGRTARAKASGIAITFINKKDQVKFQRIETLISEEILKLPTPPDIGNSPKYNPKQTQKKRKVKKHKKK